MMRAIAVTSLLFSSAMARTAALDDTPTFDVASVKPSQSGPESYFWAFRGDRFTATYVTAKSLIGAAFGVQEQALTDQQIVGGPAWIAVDHFDVEAKTSGVPDSLRGTTPGDVLAMLRRLLEERFQLSAHFEKREQQAYVLVLARRDGTLGPRMRRRLLDCVAGGARNADEARVRSFSAHHACGGRVFPGTMTAAGATMTNLVSGLARLVPDVNRVVVDRTGLIGTFDVDLTWTPDMTPGSTGGTSFFTALQEQLGLKLEPTKVSVDVLVIDRIEHPTEN